MKKKLFGAVVAPISIVGLTFALGLGSTAFATVGAGELQQSQSDSEISALNVTTEVPVAPWCGWYVAGGTSESLILEPDVEGVPDVPLEYIGTEIALTATAEENTAYVGPNAGIVAQPQDTDCSWFTVGNKYGARYDVVASGANFVARAVTGGEGTPDTGMDFSAETGNELKITNVGIDSCPSEFVTNLTAALKEGALTTTPWTVAKASVVTNNFCQWSAKYEVKIPAGMSPLYGNVSYRWTGPTLTHTLVIPEDQVGGDPAP